MPKYRKINDVFNIYRYGDRLKVVYIKSATRRISNISPLFDELEDLPAPLRADAIRSTIWGGNVVSEEPQPQEDAPKVSAAKGGEGEERFAASISRTRARIFELAMCNEFEYFCTFTQDAAKVTDRYSLDTFRKDFTQWVRNQNRGRVDKIQYLLIPEQHKDGAWHLHGFICGLKIGDDLTAFTLKDRIPHRLRKMIKNEKKLYNWAKYSNKYGYFTATPIENRMAASSYITKYVTKDVVKQGREAHRHLFFASQGLKSRETVVHNSVDNITGEVVRVPLNDDEWEYENDYVKVCWLDT